MVAMLYIIREKDASSASITSEGVTMNGRFMSFQHLKSFWIFDHVRPNEISFETKRALTPYVTIPFDNVAADEIRNSLRRFLAEEKHEEFIIDALMRAIGI